MNEWICAAVFAIAFALALAGTPVARRVASRYNLLDFPDGKLKQQRQPVAYMGGVIVYFALICSIALFFPFNRELLGILFSSSILLLVGLFDDLKAMTPGIKFVFQLLATGILVKSGVMINLVFMPLWLNVALTFFFILTFINAYNIIDVQDGLAASVGVVACLTIFLIAAFNRAFLLAVLAAALGGALSGFLKFNWAPASIYLGDAGSMFLGLIVGSLSIMGSYTARNDLAFVSAFLIVGVPLADLVYVTVLRLERGRSPFRGSPDHLALRLRRRFRLGPAGATLCLAALQMLFGGLAVANYFATPAFTLVCSGILLLLLLVGGWALAQVKME